MRRLLIFLVGIVWASASFYLDYYTKQWVMRHFVYGASYYLTPFCNIYLTTNSGVAFSLLANSDQLAIVGSLIIAVVVSLWVLASWLVPTMRLALSWPTRWSRPVRAVNQISHVNIRTEICWQLASATFLGGIWGNALDRWYYGWVIDFIDCHLGAWHFPVFNLADLWITLGAVVFFILSYQQQ